MAVGAGENGPVMLAFLIATLALSPILAAKDGTLPRGHLEPFGGHRSPDPVDETEGFPSAEQFMEFYVKESIPLVFRGAAKEFPAFKLWSEEFLKTSYPDLEVRLEAKKEKEGFVPVGAAGVGRDTISSFIDTYHNTNRYIVSELPTPMWKDVSVLPSLSCGPFISRFVEIDIWMSGGDTSSLIHKDAYNTINCVVNGTKEWKLVAFEHQDKIYQFQEETEGIGGFSRVNASAVDLLKYPLVSQVPWSFTTIQKGDCLYLPGSMWHQVQSSGDMNVAVASLFSRFEDKKIVHDFSDCSKPDSKRELAERYVPLNEVDVDLQYPGHGDMSMGIFDFETGRESLGNYFNSKGRFSLKRSAMVFRGHWQGGTDKQVREKARGLLKLLRKWTGKRNVTHSDVATLSRPALREVITFIHPAMPENTMMYEYHYVSEMELMQLIKELVNQNDGILNKQQFTEAYVKSLGGTEKFALDVFTRLQEEGSASIDLTEDLVRSRLRFAVFKYMRGEASESGFVFAGDEDEFFKSKENYAIDQDAWDRSFEEDGSERGDNEMEDSDAYLPHKKDIEWNVENEAKGRRASKKQEL